jgi:hypothetical protein
MTSRRNEIAILYTTANFDRWLMVSLFMLALAAPVAKVFFSGASVAAGVVDALIFFAAVAWTLRQRHRLAPTILDGLVVALVLLAFLQLANPNVIGPLKVLPALRNDVVGAIWYLAARAYSTNRGASACALLTGLIVPALIEMLYGLRQDILPLDIDARARALAHSSQIVFIVPRVGTPRIFGTLPGPFHLGILACCALVFVVVFWRHWERIVALLISIATLYLTYTRGNWVGGIAASGFLASRAIWVRLAERARFARSDGVRVALIASSVLAVTLAAFVAVGGSRLQTSAVRAITSDTDLSLRLSTWSHDVIPGILSSPQGYGTGAASDQLADRHGTKAYFTSHNQLFKTLLEFGWVGGGVLIGFLMLLVIRSVVRLKRAQGDPLAVAMLALVIVVVAAGITEPSLDTYPAIIPFWLAAGLLSQSP